MSFRYNYEKLNKKQLELGYIKDIAELELRQNNLKTAIEYLKTLDYISSDKIDELEKQLDIYKLQINTLKTELELALF